MGCYGFPDISAHIQTLADSHLVEVATNPLYKFINLEQLKLV